MTSEPLFGRKTIQDLELEKDFQERVCHLARQLGWRVYSVPDSRRVSLAGYPDLTMWNLKLGRLIFVELKREKGRTSTAQDTILDELRSIGQEVHLWRPSDWDDKILPTLKGNL